MIVNNLMAQGCLRWLLNFSSKFNIAKECINVISDCFRLNQQLTSAVASTPCIIDGKIWKLPLHDSEDAI